MTKSIVLFDGYNIIGKRRYLKNKKVFASPTKNIINKSLDYISNVYDTDKFKRIFVMGDGAKWIKNLPQYYKFNKDIDVIFCLDKFHLKQALYHLAMSHSYENYLLKFILENNKKSFDILVDFIKNNNPKREDTINKKYQYIISNWKVIQNLYKFGLEYHYLDDGHDTPKLTSLFESVKDINHSVVLHIHTIKGKGLKFAEENKEAWHAGGPFNVEDGSRELPNNNDTTIFDSLKELLDTNNKAIVLNAGTPMALGFTKDVREEYVKRGQFIDVGIAEENAVAMASGISRNGGTAVFGTFAPFFQRTYDQISHDLCLNDNPATMLVLSPGVYGMNSDTHLALCDISMFAYIPNLIYLAPATRKEYNDALKFATS